MRGLLLAILLLSSVRTTRSEGGEAAPIFDPIAVLDGALRHSASMRMSLCTFRQSFDARPLSAAEASRRGGDDSPPYALYMCGDSTVRNLFLAVCLAMGAPVVGNARGADTLARCEGAISGARFVAVLRGAINLVPDFVAASRRLDAALPPPSAALVGAGLWMMWPVPFAKAPTEWSTYARWAGYERELGASIAEAERARLPRLVLTTTHSQCDGAFREVWRALADKAARNRTAAALPCARGLVARQRVPLARALASCADGMRGRRASALLNQRLRAVVDARAANTSRRAATVVSVHDSFALVDGRCDANFPEYDSIHFIGLVFDELALLLDHLAWPRRNVTDAARASVRACFVEESENRRRADPEAGGSRD